MLTTKYIKSGSPLQEDGVGRRTAVCILCPFHFPVNCIPLGMLSSTCDLHQAFVYLHREVIGAAVRDVDLSGPQVVL